MINLIRLVLTANSAVLCGLSIALAVVIRDVQPIDANALSVIAVVSFVSCMAGLSLRATSKE